MSNNHLRRSMPILPIGTVMQLTDLTGPSKLDIMTNMSSFILSDLKEIDRLYSLNDVDHVIGDQKIFL